MKRCSCFGLLTLLSGLSGAIATAQPDWVKQCAQDAKTAVVAPEATAIVLCNVAECRISSEREASTHVRKAVKVLTSSGIAVAALNEAVSPERKVEDLNGWLITPDGNTTKLDDADVSEVTNNDAAVYGADRTLVAHFSQARPNDLIAFEYTVNERDETSSYQGFKLQVQEPVLAAGYSVALPRGWVLRSAEHRMEGCEPVRQENVYRWTMKNLEYQPEEPLMPPWGYLTRRILVTCFDTTRSEPTAFRDWKEVAAWSFSIHKGASLPDEAITAKTGELLQGAASTPEKVRRIAGFVRDDIRYVAVELDKGRWEPRKASATLYNRYGDCKDKTALMRAMLQAAGIPSIPVLANVSWYVAPELPTPFQFNHCVVAIASKDASSGGNLRDATVGDWVLYDPTSDETELGSLPPYLLGSTVMMVDPSRDSNLARVPRGIPENNLRRIEADVNLLPDGSFEGDAVVRDYRHRAEETRYELRSMTQEKRIESLRTDLHRVVANLDVSQYREESGGDSSAALFHVKSGPYAMPVGAMSLLKPNIFYVGEPTLLSKPTRVHPIWFGTAEQTVVEIRWHLPEGWRIDKPPRAVSDSCRAGMVTCTVTSDSSSMTYRLSERYTGRLMEAEEYSAAKTFAESRAKSRMLNLLLAKP